MKFLRYSTLLLFLFYFLMKSNSNLFKFKLKSSKTPSIVAPCLVPAVVHDLGSWESVIMRRPSPASLGHHRTPGLLAEERVLAGL